MASFLDDTARSLAEHYGRDLSGLSLVFASRRAERFFTIALNKIGVVGRPQFTTIDQVMLRFSKLEKADSLSVLSELYKIYKNIHPQETFDTFYSFGRLILGDFDSADKYMIDVSKLYSIVSETRDVEEQFRDELHESALEFWSTFQARRAQMHKEQAFLCIWQSLFAIYTELNAALAAQGKGYSGAIYRCAAEQIEHAQIAPSERYIFVGLNALSRSEKIVLDRLRGLGSADFVWDFDSRWLDEPNNEAVYFIRENIKKFPQADYFHSSTSGEPLERLNVVAAPSDIMQCKIAGTVLSSVASRLSLDQLDERTAIVLTDENLLAPLLHSLPDCASSVNISLGYPIASTLAYQLLERVIALQNSVDSARRFYVQSVLNVLQHPFVGNAELGVELLGQQALFVEKERLAEAGQYAAAIFTTIGQSNVELDNYLLRVIAEFEESSAIDEVEKYALKIIASKIVELQKTTENCGISLSRRIYITLLVDSIRSERLPYQGVSGRGVQIMGILETRALDFDNIVLLSMSDDNFPSAKSPSSYIPQNLRLAYGLPGIKEHSAIWSYYFYRLLQRAKRVTMIYCNANDQNSSGEQSRYIYQLQYNSAYELIETQLDFALSSNNKQSEIRIAKNDPVTSGALCSILSPSALNRYVNCPLAFYFNDIAGVRESQEIEEQISNLEIGNTLHLSMQELYRPFVGLENAEHLIAQITRQQIAGCVHGVMLRACGAKTDSIAQSVVLAEIAVCRMVENIVNYDSTQSTSFSILALEEPMSLEIAGVTLRGTADRVDRLTSGRVRVVDYKSGADNASFSSVESLTQGAQKEHRGAVLQLLAYSLMAAEKYQTTISAALYVARRMGAKGFADPVLRMSGRPLDPIDEQTMQQVRQAIGSLFEQINDPSVHWAQSPNRPESCTYCAYRRVCLT